MAGVKTIDVTGPANGANVYFRYDLIGLPAVPVMQDAAPATPTPRRSAAAIGSVPDAVDLRDALVLVSCVKSKLSRPAPARALYCSDWFTKVRRLVESQDARWFVLSALHGLVAPDQEIAPYELTLNKMGVAQRRTWAADVYKALVPELHGYGRVVFFAGLRYREFLAGPIINTGRQVDVPMEGLAQGEQLSWLGARQ